MGSGAAKVVGYKAGSLKTLASRSAEACQPQEFLSLEVWNVLPAGMFPKRKPQSSAASVDKDCFLQPPKEYQVLRATSRRHRPQREKWSVDRS